MISYIKGKLQYLSDSFVIIDNGGIGYKIFVSPKLMSNIGKIGDNVTVFTYMSVKDDGISLYGFENFEELEIFNKLITVSGIGPKGALGIISNLTPADFIMAVISDDVAAVSKAPGVGKKTAQRIILELKDKFKTEDFIEEKIFGEGKGLSSVVTDNSKIEAIEALTSLGYGRSEAAKAVSAVFEEGKTTEDILKLALKKLARF
ncbi:Holliday junction branch migration protein RuvA [Tyzzerella sp. An114]|uniref:Holliday junction branch migration protein RuvA n=1 Tax=Tyzzerella sp. An114 TaxID=1965545 RepID=UPI000B454EEC|nr:Holliday junction branch migration protein RuvA [Tyzzerella sp. An114]OUQ60472.1 Holliday junction branch migration protein RuvA [Tyzzerella sp. An114]HIT73838.1 Holliday junction branch migration protein RuvA [Candidatus Fimicola cottocaccae]